MTSFVRFGAVLLASLLVTTSTAYACTCDALCTKVAFPAQVGPAYPATVSFAIVPRCSLEGWTGSVVSMSESLCELSAGSAICSAPTTTSTPPVPVTLPFSFGVYTPYAPPTWVDELTFTATITWEQCKAWGTPLNDGSGAYRLSSVTTLNGGLSWTDGTSPEFSCEQAVTCLPPPPADDGCTATVGYWKTHASGRKYNATWALVGGPATPFFGSGYSYLQALSQPTETDKYFILARQYVAAVLNGFSGATQSPAVVAAMDFAEAFFAAHAPREALDPALAASVVSSAAILDGYNNGLAGPPHCE